MDVYVVIDGLPFVWDSDKAASNHRKHGVSFDRACEVFFDPLAVYEEASTGEEYRLAVIGQHRGGKMLCVVHLIREDERVRIISARPYEGAARRDHEDIS